MEQEVTLTLEGGRCVLQGTLSEPGSAHGLVIFAHGSGSSRHSPRNRHVAATLNRRGFATLLMDLLTRDEERVDAVTAELRFDIPLLATHLESTIDWACSSRLFARRFAPDRSLALDDGAFLIFDDGAPVRGQGVRRLLDDGGLGELVAA